MTKKHIPTWRERCQTHPEHQGGAIVTSRMIERRMQEEIDELRAALEGESEPKSRREYHANGTYWSGVPTMDMPCDICSGRFVVHDPRTHACPPEDTPRKCDCGCGRIEPESPVNRDR